MNIKDHRNPETNESSESEKEYLVDISPEEVFESAMEHFSQMPDVKIRGKKEPTEIVLQIGSWTSPELGNERGSVKIQISGRDGKSRLTVSYSFLMPYVVGAAYWMVIWFVLISAVSLVYADIWRLAFLYNNVLLFLTIVLVGFGVGYSVGKTKQKFETRLNLFFRTLGYRGSRR